MKLKLGSGNRTMLSQDFRRALDLRSTWFAVRVLQLEAASGRGLAKAGRPTVLRGFIRGLGKVRLERQVNGGTWQTVKRVRVRAERALLRLGQPAADDQLPPRDARRRGCSSDGENALTFCLHGLTRPSRAHGYRRLMHRLLVLAVVIAALLGVAQPAEASRYVRYGLQDDAWLVYGPGTLDERLAELDRIGVDLVRFTINWHQVEQVREKRTLGERRRGPQRAPRSRHRTGRDALRRAALGQRRPRSQLGADVWDDVRRLRVRRRETLSVGEAVARLE